MLQEGLVTNNIGTSVPEIPKTNTTPVFTVVVLADNILHNLGLNVSVAGSIRATGKTNEDLGILAAGTVAQDGLPLAVVEGVEGVAGENAAGVAARVVVELDEEGVEMGFLDHLAHLEEERVGWAFRGTSDEQAGVELAEALDHSDVGVVV